MERIGIYGGTFNPPHLGHIGAARCAAAALGLDRLLVIPDRIAPHKQLPVDSPTPEQRLEMVRLSFGGEPNVEVSDLELKREGVSYTYQTVEQLKDYYDAAFEQALIRSILTSKVMQLIRENAVIAEV